MQPANNVRLGRGPQVLPHVDIPRNQVKEKARLPGSGPDTQGSGAKGYGSGSHGIAGKKVPPHFDRPPILHRPGNGSDRDGYYPFRRDWLDNFFAYVFYVFEYNPAECVASPWYYYPNMPPYVDLSRVSQEPSSIDTSGLQPYTWHSPSDDMPGSDEYLIDTSIDRLVALYEDQDTGALDALVPSGYSIDVALDGGSGYTLSSNDFHDMMLDNITTTQTQRFSIVGVQRFAGGIRVQALHTFQDADGQTQKLLHTYILSQGDNGYTITSLKVTQPPKSF
ncbi:MAG: hypothetical protein ACHQ50_10130 [Fimbriimonadales bacterium]